LSAAAFGGVGSSKPQASPLVMRLSLDVVPLTLKVAQRYDRRSVSETE
jgi:hypothetical protein